MLELRQNGVRLQRVPEGGRFRLPNGDVVSPAYAGWQKGEFELVLVVQPEPQPEDEPMPVLSFAQMLIGLVTEKWISEEEGDAWREGRLPGAVLNLIEKLPPGKRFAARVRASRPAVVLRNDELLMALAAAQSLTPSQVDRFFRKYSKI